MTVYTPPAVLAAARSTYFRLLDSDPRDLIPKRTLLPLDLVVSAVVEHYERHIGMSYHFVNHLDNDYVIVNDHEQVVKLHVTEDPAYLDDDATCAVLLTQSSDDNNIFDPATAPTPRLALRLNVIEPGRDDHYVDPTPLLIWLHYWITDARMPAADREAVFGDCLIELS